MEIWEAACWAVLFLAVSGGCVFLAYAYRLVVYANINNKDAQMARAERSLRKLLEVEDEHDGC